MKKNMGIMDRFFRLVIVAAFIALYFGGIVVGTPGIVLIVLATIFFLTSFVGYCPLYAPFGWNTVEKMATEE